MSTATEPRPKLAVMSPSEAAARLGTSTLGLTALIRKYRYEFTEVSPGGKPGDRGRNRWGLTEAQYAAIVAGQKRTLKAPELPTESPRPSPVSPDGKSRLRRGGRARL